MNAFVFESGLPLARPAPAGGEGESPPALREVLEAAGLAPDVLDRASGDAARANVPFEEALYARGEIGERAGAAILARRLGASVAGREARGAPGTAFAAAVAAGILRLADGRLAVVPRGRALRHLLAALAPGHAGIEAGRLALIDRRRLVALAAQADRTRLAAHAAGHLAGRTPHLSASDGVRRWQAGLALAAVCGLAFLAVDDPGTPHLMLGLVTAVFFLALAVIRLAAVLAPPQVSGAGLRLADADLPVYTVLVPLLRERAALPGLVAALGRLDYPKARLDAILLVEEDDRITRRALSGLALPGWITVLPVPAGEPRTKPRALNAGLAIARGEVVVVYDAEDRPAPEQLRAALAALRRAGPRVAVVQARLAIDPRQRGALAAQFALEYAGLFGILLPSLAALGLPVPLGGTSNHFRTPVLRRLGGWDAHNVTEDADIGMRLHRRGYRAATIASDTEEEAPPGAFAWLRQRTRWMKGWMVTLLVHTRQPLRLLADLGTGGTIGFLLLTGGIVASALLEPVCIALVLFQALGGSLAAAQSPLQAIAVSSFVWSCLLGHLAGALVCVRGAAHLGVAPALRTLALLPLYWLAISLAAWRALWQVVTGPLAHWEKTEHILSRMPR